MHQGPDGDRQSLRVGAGEAGADDVDLVELSGGSYESPAMSGRPADDRTGAREAYFLELATQLARTSPLPLMLTGGISRRETAEKVLDSGVVVTHPAYALARDQLAQGRALRRYRSWLAASA